MAVTLDAATKVFTVPQADLTLVTGTFYRMDTESYFRTEVNALMDDAAYIWMDTPITHNTEVTVAGVTYARFIELINGYSVTFSPDSQWTVELTGSNNNLFDVENNILNQNQVQVIPTNSAGLVGAKQIQDSAFTDSRVWMDITNGSAGTTYPKGTPGDPSNNLTDTQSIVTARLLPSRLHLRGALTMTGADNVDEYDIVGSAPNLASIALGGASTSSTHIQGCALSGVASGSIAIGFCEVDAVSGFDGLMHDCVLASTLTLGATATAITLINNESLSETAIIDMNSVASARLTVSDHTGYVEIQNCDDAGNTVFIDIAGHVTINANCTAGTITITGEGKITDNGTATVDSTAFVEAPDLKHLWQDRGFDADNPLTADETAGTLSVAGTIRTWVGTAIKTLTRTT